MSEGLQQSRCTNCGTEEMISLPMTEHEFADGYCIYCKTPENSEIYADGTIKIN